MPRSLERLGFENKFQENKTPLSAQAAVLQIAFYFSAATRKFHPPFIHHVARVARFGSHIGSIIPYKRVAAYAGEAEIGTPHKDVQKTPHINKPDPNCLHLTQP
jgi:hypothetical protein